MKFLSAMCVVACLVQGVASTVVYAQGHTYRYVNDEGVKVMTNSMPPKHVHKGYEILSSTTGRVIGVVEPAPDPELVVQERALAELKLKYEHLAKRYSSVRDIEATKQRKLVHVDASILLADNSVANVQKEIDEIMKQAATYERAGKQVPDVILKTLKGLNEKMEVTRTIQKSRMAEKKAITERFEQEKVLFTKGVEAFAPELTKTAAEVLAD